MMYDISVPVISERVAYQGREEILDQLRRFQAKRVFLALDSYEEDPEKNKGIMERLADNCRFFRENGFEVGVWIWTFLVPHNTRFGNMRCLDGKEMKDTACPSDETFVKFAAEYMQEVARCKPDLLLFDDDFRYGFVAKTPCCLCDEHIRRINKITGDVKTRQQLKSYILRGKKNPYRDAYLKANGDAFRHFAAEIRRAVDEVNPAIRIGACACMTSWDIDGTNARELATILAGNTKPFLRLIGAPYWGALNGWGNRLEDVIELERMESSWTKADGIEIMAEGDTYPRPRFRTSAAYLEGFDTAIRASGCTDGILKYGIDYVSLPQYETGYLMAHERHKDLYRNIDRIFGDKQPCGVRVFEAMNKVADMQVPTKVNSTANIENFFFSKAARTLACNTVPTVYEGVGTGGIVFGENARHLPLEWGKCGWILDIQAAEILTQRGLDVGLVSIGKETEDGLWERMADTGNRLTSCRAKIYDIKLKDGAEILSDIETSLGTLPVSYRYENADGGRFLVLNINTRKDNDRREALMRHYARGRQYADMIPWVSGKRLPAYVYGSPDLYMQCKKNDTAMAVGLWNFHPDAVIEPVVELDHAYQSIEFIQGSGRLEGDKVMLDEIPPYGFVGFEVKD